MSRSAHPRRLTRAALCLLLAVCAAATAAAPASATPVIGVGEHDARMFSDPHWQALAARPVRVVVAWDVLQAKQSRTELDHYMTAARAAGAEVLVSFGRSRTAGRTWVLPSTARMAQIFQAFRARYPWVQQYVTWNEANHCSQPTCRRPERVAEYFDAMRRRCPSCQIVAADVLDTDAMPAWVARFRKAAKTKGIIWGLHNYVDANRMRTTGTKALLKATTGPVWFTETGGVVWRENAARPHRLLRAGGRPRGDGHQVGLQAGGALAAGEARLLLQLAARPHLGLRAGGRPRAPAAGVRRHPRLARPPRRQGRRLSDAGGRDRRGPASRLRRGATALDARFAGRPASCAGG